MRHDCPSDLLERSTGALKAVGIILAIAFLVAPGAIAFLVTRRFGMMLVVAIGITVFAGISGIYASFFLDSAPAPTIVMVMTILFIAAFLRTTFTRQAISP